MPLFICAICQTLENTAVSNYWHDAMVHRKPLCSQCDPRVKKWHGRFERTQYDPEIHVEDIGILNRPEVVKTQEELV